MSLRAREIFTARTSELFLSVASIWEILIKVQLKKLPLTKPVVPFLREQLANNNIHVLPIVLDHVVGWKTCQCTTAILSTAFWSLRAWKRVGRCFRPILSWLAIQQN